jgi:hypothetical protein
MTANVALDSHSSPRTWTTAAASTRTATSHEGRPAVAAKRTQAPATKNAPRRVTAIASRAVCVPRAAHTCRVTQPAVLTSSAAETSDGEALVAVISHNGSARLSRSLNSAPTRPSTSAKARNGRSRRATRTGPWRGRAARRTRVARSRISAATTQVAALNRRTAR